MKRVAIAALVVVPAIAACGDRTLPPRGELLLYVDTDAPLALAPGERPRSDTPFGLFDRMRVETLLTDGTPACTTCTRDFSVDRSQLAARKLSVGILPGGRTDLLVRVRLFRATAAANGTPRQSATIDRTFTVPPIGAEGVVEATAVLPVEATGLGPSAGPETLRAGPPGVTPIHGSIVRTPCTTAGQDGEVCIPGLAFWMADPRFQAGSTTGEEIPERLVALSPFWVDDREVTVARMRASGVARASDPAPTASNNPYCNYTASPGPTDAFPVNCVTWATADAFCRAKGARLPTDAEQEALLGARHGHRYVWGEDDPTCEDLVFGRAPPERATSEDVLPTSCLRFGVGAQPAGTGRRDVIDIDGRQVFDIAGNLSEWVVDVSTPPQSACRGEGFTRDPVCTRGSSSHITRGTSWALYFFSARASSRLSIPEELATFDIGFRCVRPGR